MKSKDSLTTGIDIVNVNRIREIISEKKDRFYDKLFTEKEIEYLSGKGNQPTSVAGLFAAKEAVSKAIGTGIGSVNWKDIEIIHDGNGKPYVNLMGKGKERTKELGIDNMELSISHEEDYAIAFVVGYLSGRMKIKIDNDIKELLPKRISLSHKGTYGRVAIIGGSKGMTGAPYLASQAALKTGTGLVYTIVPKLLETIMCTKLTESIIKAVEDNDMGYFIKRSLPDILKEIKSKDVIAIGPGFGVDDDKLYVIEEVINNFKNPIVLDADGLNCLSIKPDILFNHNHPIIITPHPGELARLLGKDTKEIQENRIYYSKYISQKYNVIVVLKGSNTIVASPNEDVYINTTGNSGMATAGSGDLLTGIIASFIGQGLEPTNAARLGVYVHGLAGDLARIDKGEYGMIATDILEKIPYSIKKIQG